MATNNPKMAVGVSRIILDLDSDFALLISLDTLQLTSLLGLNATTPLYEAKMKAEATQKDLLVLPVQELEKIRYHIMLIQNLVSL